MMNYKVFILCCYFHCLGFSQVVHMDSCWSSPIGISPELSAGFGDIRPNHFHMGLDFRTNGIEGIALFSIADGYVSRIRISSSGYGRVIYVNHPNGMTSVYAHCSSFSERITAFILSIENQFQQNEVDWILREDQLIVHKGEQIALSGNSGNSTGPHLHFELRDTKTEHALNPLLHGFHVSDTAPPTLHGIRILAIDQNGYIIPGKSLHVPLTKLKHTIKIPKDFITENEKLGVCISATDPMKIGGHGFALFSAELWTSSVDQFGFELQEISFDDTRYVNSHIDYHEYMSNGIKFQKLFRTKINPLEIYTSYSTGGLSLHGNDSLQCSLILSDINGNTSQHTLELRYPFSIKKSTASFFNVNDYFLPDSAYQYRSANFHIEVNSNTFYEPVRKSMNLVHGQFGSPKTVLQQAVCIEMKALKSYSIDKQYVAIGGTALETSREGEWLAATSKQLGNFVVKIDSLIPSIQFLPTSSNSVVPTLFSWKVTDLHSGILSYHLFIDGLWTPVYLDQKSNIIRFVNNKRITVIGPSEQSVKLELVVTDRCGNVAVWRKSLGLMDERH